jgi:lipopolysaccharide transport system ATP-binding protein
MRGRVGALIALGAGFNPILTGRENIYINGSVLGLSKKEIDAKIDEIIDFAEIREFIDMPVQSYSSGMTVRLGFAVATALDPDVLILDEVLAVGDMAFQAKCLKRIGKLRENGVAMIFVSHNFHQMSMACDTGLVLEKGEKLIKDDIKKALDFYEIKTRKKSKISSDESKWSSENVDINLNHISNSFQEKDESIISPNTPFSIIFDVFSRYLENHGIILDTRIEDSLGTLTQFSSAEKNIILPPGKSVIQVDYSGIATHGESLRFNFAIWSKHEKCIIAWSKGHKIYVEKKSGIGGREACNVSFRLN